VSRAGYLSGMKLLPLFEGMSLDTKVADAKGRPLTMYHGGSWTGSGDFKGIGWFTRSRADARHYARNGGTITPVYLIIKKPFYSGDVGHLKLSAKDFPPGMPHKNGFVQFIETNWAVHHAKDNGYDGVINLTGGEILDAIVWNPHQIIVKPSRR